MAMHDYQDAKSCEGTAEARRIVQGWLEIIKKSVEIEGDIPLELWNVGLGQEGPPVYATEWDITEPVDNVLDELMEHAEEDALNIGRGAVRFKVIVEDMKKAGRAAFTLRIPNNGELNLDDMEDIDELATQKGLLTQLMRHQEKTMKVGLGGSDKTMSHMSKMLDAAYKRINELEAQYMNNAKTYEELLSGKHMRDLELRKLDNDERRKEQVAGILMQGVPLLLNKFLMSKPPELGQGTASGVANGNAVGVSGGKPVEETSTTLELMVEGFFHTFTPNQLQDIMQKNVFTPQQMMMFVEIAKVIQSRIYARESAQQAAGGSGSSGSGGSGGGEGGQSPPPAAGAPS